MKIKVKEIFKNYIYPLSVLSGTIIGVGLFSLPYITSKVGIGLMVVYFLLLGTVAILIHYFFGELVLKTPDYKRLPGFAEIYLGKKGKIIAYFSSICGLYGASLAYLIVGGEFLESLLSPYLGGNSFFYTFGYFLVGSLLIFLGIKAISWIEFLGLILFLLVLGLIFLKGLPFYKIENIFCTSELRYWFLPYGPILFSLWGASLIPEVEEMLGRNKKLLKKIIPISILIPILVYICFILIILGITGISTTESALPGLKNFLGNGIVFLTLIFGILTTFTSYITIGLTLKKLFMFDIGIKKRDAFIISCFLPMILFLLGMKSFINIISFVGGVLLAVDGILVLLMYQKCFKKKISAFKYSFIYLLILMFLAGIIYEIVYFVK